MKTFEKTWLYTPTWKQFQKRTFKFLETLAAAANVSYLDKALRLAQLSVIEYFNELAFYYDTLDAYFQIEKA